MSSAMQKLAPLARRLVARKPVQTRSFAADAHGEVKLNFWEAPTEVAKWKEEHIVLVVLAGWGVSIYGAMKIFGGKKEAAPESPAA